MTAQQSWVQRLERLLAAFALAAGVSGGDAAELTVSTSFEGGSAIVETVDGQRRVIAVRPGGDPDRGWPCWWYFRVDGLSRTEAMTVVVRGSSRPVRNNGRGTGRPLAASWSLPARAAVSVDGATWFHSEPGRRGDDHVAYRIAGGEGPVWVAWGPPFTSRESETLCAKAAALPHGNGTVFELARTREGRSVPGIRFASPRRRQLPVVWIQARQHAWESGSSWVAQGFVEWLLGDEAEAGWLREHAEVCVIPVMDVDRVATGDGGKESAPHDHNRDWSDTPYYPEIAATQRRLKAYAREKRLAVFLDLHNPGPNDLQPYFYVPPAEQLADAARANQARFLQFAARRLDPPLALAGPPRTTGPAYHPLWRQISSVWVGEHSNPGTLAACLETSWNTPHSTTAGYCGVGAKLGRAVTDYLQAVSPGNAAVADEPAR